MVWENAAWDIPSIVVPPGKVYALVQSIEQLIPALKTHPPMATVTVRGLYSSMNSSETSPQGFGNSSFRHTAGVELKAPRWVDTPSFGRANSATMTMSSAADSLVGALRSMLCAVPCRNGTTEGPNEPSMRTLGG